MRLIILEYTNIQQNTVCINRTRSYHALKVPFALCRCVHHAQRTVYMFEHVNVSLTYAVFELLSEAIEGLCVVNTVVITPDAWVGLIDLLWRL